MKNVLTAAIMVAERAYVTPVQTSTLCSEYPSGVPDIRTHKTITFNNPIT